MAINNLSHFPIRRESWVSRKSYRRHAFYWWAGIIILLIIVYTCSGCTPASTVARIDGFEAQYRGFDRLESEPFDPIITDLKIRVIVLPEFNGGTYSHPDGIITLKGKKIGGKILTCPAVLGHEMQHALEYQGKGFFNPDQSEAYGY